MKKRLIRLAAHALLVVAAGVAYGAFVGRTGFALPCLFRHVTGLKCPGCGTTGMCLALMRLDFAGAFCRHPMLFTLLAPLGIVFAGAAAAYVRDGSRRMSRWQNALLYACIALLVGFGVARNIAEFAASLPRV